MRVRVPPLVVLRIAEAEVAADVDDRAPLAEPGRRELRGFTRRQRGEDDLSVARILADDEGRRRGVEMRLHIAQRLALAPTGDRGDEPGLRMAQQQTRELAARVSRRVDDRHLDRHRRILCGGPNIY